MPRGKRRVKEGVWVAVAFFGLLAYTLLADWWKENTAIGWTIIGVLLVLLAFFAYRYASFRGWLGRTAKRTCEKIVFEEGEPPREPLPPQLHQKVMNRAHYHCQNPDCRYTGKPHVHHINMDNSDNRLSNLVALYPNCHTDTHRGKHKPSKVRNWSRLSSQR